MSKIYVEVSNGLVSNIYTDLEEDVEVMICDYDCANQEHEGDGFDFSATRDCEELEQNKEMLRHIY